MHDLTGFLEIRLKSEEDFLKIRENLTRIGVASHKDRTLYQSCHILHKKGHYYLVHFKEMFLLDGKPSDITDSDYARRNAIAKLLQEWGLIDIASPEQIVGNLAPLYQIKIIPYREKEQWNLVPKYTIGKKSFNSPEHT